MVLLFHVAFHSSFLTKSLMLALGLYHKRHPVEALAHC